MTDESRTGKVLKQAKSDLEYAEFPGYPGKLFNTIRERLLIPVTGWAGDAVPAVVHKIPLPFVDAITAFSLTVPFTAAKMSYSLLPHKEVEEEATEAVHNELFALGAAAMADPEMQEQLELEPNFLSSLKGVVGFLGNTIKDLALMPFRQLDDWTKMTFQFVGYLMYSGIGVTLFKAFANNRAIENVTIIGRTQEKYDSVTVRQNKVAMKEVPPSLMPSPAADFKDIMKDAARFVRYATAAYGVEMIDSAVLLQAFGKKFERKEIFEDSEALRKRKISKYVNVDKEDIVALTPTGGDINLLGHLLIVDRKRDSIDKAPSVVLAIRGTYTISGLKIDAAGFSRPFLDGRAHAGIADRAEYLWRKVELQVLGALTKNPGCSFVITGHSLGAGAAALLAMKLNYEKLTQPNHPLKEVKVKCFAFACPPVYYHDDQRSEKLAADAMKNTYAFIHESDCVSFLSVFSVQELADKVIQVDKQTKFKPILRLLMATGTRNIPQKIVNAAIGVPPRELPLLPNAEQLAIPAPYVIWLRHVSDETVAKKVRPKYNAMFCRPRVDASGAVGTNDLGVMVTKRMISDHMNPMYERAVNSILEQIIGGEVPGYDFPN